MRECCELCTCVLLLFGGTVFLAFLSKRSKPQQRSGGAEREYHPHPASRLQLIHSRWRSVTDIHSPDIHLHWVVHTGGHTHRETGPPWAVGQGCPERRAAGTGEEAGRRAEVAGSAASRTGPPGSAVSASCCWRGRGVPWWREEKTCARLAEAPTVSASI